MSCILSEGASLDRHNKDLGDFGERLACQYLQKRGYQILATQLHTRGGEIDILATKHGLLIAIEVKTRSSTQYGYPEEAVNQKKLAHILYALRQIQAKNPQVKNLPTRVEVVCVLGNNITRHIRDLLV